MDKYLKETKFLGDPISFIGIAIAL